VRYELQTKRPRSLPFDWTACRSADKRRHAAEPPTISMSMRTRGRRRRAWSECMAPHLGCGRQCAGGPGRRKLTAAWWRSCGPNAASGNGAAAAVAAVRCTPRCRATPNSKDGSNVSPMKSIGYQFVGSARPPRTTAAQPGCNISTTPCSSRRGIRPATLGQLRRESQASTSACSSERRSSRGPGRIRSHGAHLPLWVTLALRSAAYPPVTAWPSLVVRRQCTPT